MLTTILFSKDRPLQLDLCLNSVKKNWVGGQIVILYKTSDYRYAQAYGRLREEHPNFIFIQQTESFNNGFEKCLKMCQEYVGFLTDDNIVYSKCDTMENDLHGVFNMGQNDCLSLRLGLNITQRDGVIEKIPRIQRNGKYLEWNRMQSLAQSYWNYPLSVDGHIFKYEFIKNLWEEIYHKSISGPNKLETLMQRFFFEISPFMACETYSHVVNSPNNRVQDEVKNWHGVKWPYSPEYLLGIYEAGRRIVLEDLEFSILCPHTEIDVLKNLP